MAKMNNRNNRVIRALALSAVLLATASSSALAIRQLTEAERAAVIAEYLAEKEAKEAAKAAETPAPAVAPAPAPAEVKVVVEAAKTDVAKAPEVTVKVTEEKPAEAKAEAKATASADVAPKVVEIKAERPEVNEESYWGMGPQPQGVDFPIEQVKGVTTLNLPATLPVKGNAVEISVGDSVAKVYPTRGITVTLKELAARDILVAEVQGGKAVVKKLPNVATWPADKPVSFEAFTCLEDFLRLEPYGLVVTAVGVGNTEEAIAGHKVDNAVRTTAVLENPHLNEDGRISGVRNLYNVATKRLVSSTYYADYDTGVVYWVQMRTPCAAKGSATRRLHWRSAKYRAERVVANDAVRGQQPHAFFTVQFGAQEGTERVVNGKIVGQEGRENTIPVRPLVRLSQEDQIALIEAYKAKMEK